jgi:hypothetical protein
MPSDGTRVEKAARSAEIDAMIEAKNILSGMK